VYALCAKPWFTVELLHIMQTALQDFPSGYTPHKAAGLSFGTCLPTVSLSTASLQGLGLGILR